MLYSLLRLSVPLTFLQLALLFEKLVICLPLALQYISRTSSSPRIHNQIKQIKSSVWKKGKEYNLFLLFFSHKSFPHLSPKNRHCSSWNVDSWNSFPFSLSHENIPTFSRTYHLLEIFICVSTYLSLQFLFTIISVVFIIIILSFLAVKTLNSNSLCWD